MYDFRTLSYLDFEDLVRDLLQSDLNLRMESFGPGKDFGIDFRFSVAHGQGIVQAKHFLNSGMDALIRAARAENEKVKRLAPARYVIATSLSLTPHQKIRLQQAMPDAPLATEDILGREDLNNLLGRHPEIERKHFKLWLSSTAVLERILHSGVYNRTEIELDAIRNLVPKFVHNDSIAAAEGILQRSGALIIAGEPGVGKTTLARMLVWLHAQQNWHVSVIDDIREAFEILSGDEKRLIFFDDFLGQVRLSTDLVRGMDQRFPPFLHKVRSNKNLRFILTTRDYILRQAQAHSDRLASPAVNASEFTLNVGHYTRATRARILYNHLYFSDVSDIEIESLLDDDYFLKIIDHRNYNPRLVDLLTSSDYLSVTSRPIRDVVEDVLDNPQHLWEKPYRSHISDEGRALMLALFFNDPVTPLQSLEQAFVRIVEAMGFPMPEGDRPVKFRSALRELEGSVLAIQARSVRFSSPGVRDFLLRAVTEDQTLSIAIKAVEELAEVRQCWTVFSTQDPRPAKGHPETNSWVAAASRLVSHGNAGPLQLLEVLIDMYDQLQCEGILNLVIYVVDSLEPGEIDGTEAERGGSVLEQLASSGLPYAELNKASQVITAATAQMLADYGDSLNFDEIMSAGNKLYAYGSDADLAVGAITKGIEAYIANIGPVLSEIHSVDELDEFECELRRFMEEYGIVGTSAATDIRHRRETLLERDENDDEGYGRSVSLTPSHQVSDDQIRSMFRGLRDR